MGRIALLRVGECTKGNQIFHTYLQKKLNRSKATRPGTLKCFGLSVLH